ncbi:MAG: hypothetical protein GX945_00215 [Lentisphaerae bacterium]|nr:hypothetical protein [Lentisphaerota bacterium]
MEEYEQERWMRLFTFGINCSFGTLWYIREDLLKRAMSGYDQQSTRKAHPGVSINRAAPTGLRDVVSMLVGTSKVRGYGCFFSTTGISPNAEPEKRTYFNILRPVRVQPYDFLNTREAPADIERNTHKPSLTAKECKKLKTMINRQLRRTAQ